MAIKFGTCVNVRPTLKEDMSLKRLEKVDTTTAEWHSLLKEVVAKCLKAGPVKAIYVFGSFAEGRMTAESDLDLAVILPNDLDAKIFRSRLSRPLCSWPTDLIVVSEARFDERKDFGGVLVDVYHDGIELYPNWRLSTSHDDT